MKGSGLSIINVVKYLVERERKAVKGAIRMAGLQAEFRSPNPHEMEQLCLQYNLGARDIENERRQKIFSSSKLYG
jgi:hypothetical protein